jgi:hypothetical protein
VHVAPPARPRQAEAGWASRRYGRPGGPESQRTVAEHSRRSDGWSGCNRARHPGLQDRPHLLLSERGVQSSRSEPLPRRPRRRRAPGRGSGRGPAGDASIADASGQWRGRARKQRIAGPPRRLECYPSPLPPAERCLRCSHRLECLRSRQPGIRTSDGPRVPPTGPSHSDSGCESTSLSITGGEAATPEASPRGALEAYEVAGDRAHRSHLLDPCWTEITISEPGETVTLSGPGNSIACVVAKPDVRTHGIRIPARDAHCSHKVKAPRANRPRGLHYSGAPYWI